MCVVERCAGHNDKMDSNTKIKGGGSTCKARLEGEEIWTKDMLIYWGKTWKMIFAIIGRNEWKLKSIDVTTY